MRMPILYRLIHYSEMSRKFYLQKQQLICGKQFLVLYDDNKNFGKIQILLERTISSPKYRRVMREVRFINSWTEISAGMNLVSILPGPGQRLTVFYSLGTNLARIFVGGRPGHGLHFLPPESMLGKQFMYQ